MVGFSVCGVALLSVLFGQSGGVAHTMTIKQFEMLPTITMTVTEMPYLELIKEE